MGIFMPGLPVPPIVLAIILLQSSIILVICSIIPIIPIIPPRIDGCTTRDAASSATAITTIAPRRSAHGARLKKTRSSAGCAALGGREFPIRSVTDAASP